MLVVIVFIDVQKTNDSTINMYIKHSLFRPLQFKPEQNLWKGDLLSLTTLAPDASDRLQGLLIKSLAPAHKRPSPTFVTAIPHLTGEGRIYSEQSQFNTSSLLLAEVIRTRSNVGLSQGELEGGRN